jgi:putative acetyltransferase
MFHVLDILALRPYREKKEEACTVSELSLREFQPGDESAFKAINEQWITRYFALEPKDLYNLEHPQETILDKGGRIYFTLRGEEIVGCCALIAIGPGEYELAKMGVLESARGSGAGRFQLQAVVEKAWKLGAKRIYLETNHALTPAIHLYEAVGFQPVPPERIVPSPYARADVYMEMFA